MNMKMKMKMTKMKIKINKISKKKLLTILVFALLLVLVDYLAQRGQGSARAEVDPGLSEYTKESLAQYDGSDLDKPVLLAMEGLVYDVSPGRDEFYNPGQGYHYLAGRDATLELLIAGGSIIKRKYQVVGIYK